MNGAERDSISIKRDALLAKKRILDFIDLLAQKGPKGNNYLTIQAKFLSEKAEIRSEAHFDNLLEAISQDGVVTFKKAWPVDYWKNYLIEVRFTKDFNDYIYRIREEYHLLNDLLRKNHQKKFIGGINIFSI